MSLKSCRHCGYSVAQFAKVCPKCGGTDPAPGADTNKVARLLILFVVVAPMVLFAVGALVVTVFGKLVR